MSTKKLYRLTDYKRENPASATVHEYRSEFRRDFARLLHSPSFRRLAKKRQLLPNDESDFFRNRLTHSLEVAQVAKTIALKLNHESQHFRIDPIDTDLVEFAGLAHDLGHPPFGHTGESQLDILMRETGGFEGNAQTLRILARLEKKQEPEKPIAKFSVDTDPRPGLNLTYRALASVLKYDQKIKENRKGANEVAKGYYASEAALVVQIKRSAVGTAWSGKFKTIECSIMDIADDIAYSTYDLEDAFKAGLLSPLTLYSTLYRMTPDEEERFLARITKNVQESYPEKDKVEIANKARRVLRSFLLEFFDETRKREFEESTAEQQLAQFAMMSDKICSDGYARIGVTSWLINDAIKSVTVEVNNQAPCMSRVRLGYEAMVRIETLKRVAWTRLIDTRKLKMIERRERMIIKRIFDALTVTEDGYELLPDDYRHLYALTEADDELSRKRIVCDFISGMTDRYAEGFYVRLRRNTDSVFLPF